MAQATDPSPAIEFITALFGPTTERPVFFQTLANDKGDVDESRIQSALVTREPDRVIRFISKHDRSRRGMYFCVSTVEIGALKRNKETVRECPALFTDLDFKTIAEDGPVVRAALDAVRLLPSIIVRTGGGYHVYWLLKEAADAQLLMERIEAALKRLAWLLGGDPKVCEVSRLMRVPGTHNSKYGDMREVVREVFEPDRRYELEELEEWLAEERAPILTYVEPIVATRASKSNGAGHSAPAEPGNPFLAHGERYGFRPALDVEEMLNAMAPGNVHDTQVRCSAALMKAGHDIEDVVSLLLDVTRVAVGDVGAKWNWQREERKIRGMSATAVVKYPPRELPKLVEQNQADEVSHETSSAPGDADGAADSENEVHDKSDAGGATVHDLGAARTRKERKPKQAASTHIILAEAVLAVTRERGLDLMFSDAGDYRYGGGLWRLEIEKAMKAWLDRALEEGCRGLKMESTDRLIREARNYILRLPELHRENVPFDQHGWVPVLGELVNPRTGEVTAMAREHYCTWRVPFAYDPAAVCPHWLQMLEDVFADRAPDVRSTHIQIIQELLGAGLIDRKAKALSRALVLVGGSDYGKSGLIDVMAGLFGDRKNATPMDALESAHGLMPFANRVPWVLHEAFDAGKWHLSSIVKALISGDEIQINIKGGKIFSHRFTAPAIWGANSSPNFKEATDAIINRLVVIECRRKFDEHHPVGTALEASRRGFDRPQDLVRATEMEGVLVWAIEGLKRALARGHFVLPADAVAAAETVRIESNLVAGFIRDCTEFDPGAMISTPDFCAAFASWWLENKGEGYGIPRAERVGWAIKALGDPRIAADREELRDKVRRYYAGVKLNAEGRRHWKNTVSSDAYVFQGRTTNTSDPSEGANKAIPTEWDCLTAISAMRVAYEKKRDRSKDHLSATDIEESRSSDEETD